MVNLTHWTSQTLAALRQPNKQLKYTICNIFIVGTEYVETLHILSKI